jgi:hypothetical protein
MSTATPTFVTGDNSVKFDSCSKKSKQNLPIFCIFIMEIINEVKEKESKSDDKKEKPKFVARNMAEVQKAKLDKLMKNPVCISFAIFENVSNLQALKHFRKSLSSSLNAGIKILHTRHHPLLSETLWAQVQGLDQVNSMCTDI